MAVDWSCGKARNGRAVWQRPPPSGSPRAAAASGGIPRRGGRPRSIRYRALHGCDAHSDPRRVLADHGVNPDTETTGGEPGVQPAGNDLAPIKPAGSSPVDPRALRSAGLIGGSYHSRQGVIDRQQLSPMEGVRVRSVGVQRACSLAMIPALSSFVPAGASQFFNLLWPPVTRHRAPADTRGT